MWLWHRTIRVVIRLLDETPGILLAHTHSVGRKDESPMAEAKENPLALSISCPVPLVSLLQFGGIRDVACPTPWDVAVPTESAPGETSPFRCDWESAARGSCSSQGRVTQGPVS